MKNINKYITEKLKIRKTADPDNDINELYNKVKLLVNNKMRTELIGIVEINDFSYIYIIYQSPYGYKGAMYDLKKQKLSDYYKPTKAYETVEEVQKFIEKNWIFDKDIDEWYWGRNDDKERNDAPKAPEKKKPTTVADTDLTQCKNAEEIITKLAEYLGINKYDISNTTVTRYKVQIKGKMIPYRGKEITIYDGTYQASYGSKGYARKKGFTVRLNIEDTYGHKYTDLDYRLGPQGNDFISSYFGRYKATIKTLADRINIKIDNINK